MARTLIVGPEEGDFSASPTTGGTTSVATVPAALTGVTYAQRVNPTTTALGYAFWQPYGTNGRPIATQSIGTTVWCKFWLYVVTRPASGSEEIFSVLNTSSAYKAFVRLKSDGKLELYTGGSTLAGTSTTATATNTWEYVEVKVGPNGASSALELKLNGNAEITTTQTASGTNGWIIAGKGNNRSSQTIDVYLASIEVDDATWCGASKVTGLVPNAAGNYQTGTASAGTHQACVDERPPNGATDYVTTSGTAGQNETNAFQNSSSASISGTVNCVRVQNVVARTAAAGSVKGMTRSATTDSVLATAFTTTVTYTSLNQFFATDPATSAAWTTGGVDGLEGGVQEASASTSRLTSTIASVSWTPAAGGAVRSPVMAILAGSMGSV